MSVHNGHPVKLGELLVLSTEDEPFRLHNALLHVEYLTGSETEYDIRITFEGNESLWAEIQERSLFGVKAENVGALFGGGFKSHKPLVFELRQRTTSTTLIGIMTEHPLDAAIQIIESPPDSELRQSKHYQLVAVKQQLFPGTYVGLQIAHPEQENIDDYEIDSPDSIPQHSDIQAVQDSLLADFEAVLKKPTSP